MKNQDNPLVSIIGDEQRVSLLRLFALNPEVTHAPQEIAKALKKPLPKVKDTLKKLEKDKIVIKKKIPLSQQRERKLNASEGYAFNARYKHTDFLRDLLKATMPNERDLLVSKIGRVPGVKLVLTTDLFGGAGKKQADMLIASSERNTQLLEQIIREAERVIGREIQYVMLSPNDMVFRLQTNDKFLKDILALEYTLHIDRLGLLQ